jgi:serine/threonine protein kinase
VSDELLRLIAGADEVPPPHVGQRIDGRYLIEEVLGAGGLGMVVRARDERLDRAVSLKFATKVPTDETMARRVRRRLTREAKVLARLEHPNLVRILDLGYDGARIYLVMEYVRARSLAELLRQRGALGGAEALDIMRPVLDVLVYAHDNGVIHRDIKPENILVGRHGMVWLVDFDIALAHGLITESSTTGRIGTARYMAPEQLRGDRGDERVDIWACGLVLAELLLGRDRVEASGGLDEVASAVPRPVATMVKRALQPDPGARFGSMGEMREALRGARDAVG